ncbi:dihydrofolate reductase family protein [Spirosoma foliorum]|uniref:Dihydrofolate reductase n=1 Tax=Spirosoma foliorum TaxID=2710596 RepID=A0A7G5H6B1_9BACT|nr:dihydrofolate reductase family protein [Spirosoma foliorum]QMW06653.1 dihydrofolate reductase [Spirosoma foliorum]
MRAIILNLAVSLDGFIEGPNGEYDWCFTDQDYGMTDFLARIDALFMGRKTYELLTNPDEPASNYAFPDYKRYVFSNTLQEVESGFELIRGDLKAQVNGLKSQSGKDIWLFGGADLTAAFLEEGLVDELLLAIHPIILGGGKPLFTKSKERINLTLSDSKTYSSGLVSVSYKLKE